MTLPPINEMATLSILVSEEIESKSLHSFLQTTILNSDVLTSENSHYSFFYNQNTLTYEIIIFEQYSNTRLPEPFNFINHFPVDDKKIRVYLRKNYFIITQSNKILIFKSIKSSNEKEISLYIKQFYKITDFEVVSETTDFIHEEKRDKYVLSYIHPLYNKKSFNYFLGFTFISIFVLVFFIYQENIGNNEVPRQAKSKQKEIFSIKNPIIVSTVPDVFSYIKLNNIEMKKLFYVNEQLKTTLVHNEKSHLLEFVNRYQKYIRLKSLKYDKVKALYILDVILEF